MLSFWISVIIVILLLVFMFFAVAWYRAKSQKFSRQRKWLFATLGIASTGVLVIAGYFAIFSSSSLPELIDGLFHPNAQSSHVINSEQIPENALFPIESLIIDKAVVGEWTYFRYFVETQYDEDNFSYPALFRSKGDNEYAERVSGMGCLNFVVAQNSVFYIDLGMITESYGDHGVLYVSRPDGKTERLLEEELHSFQIIDEKIFYTFRHDTTGVGAQGHALWRMELSGSKKMIVAYEVGGVGLKGSHFDFTVKDGWAFCGNYRIALGFPATGLERLEILSDFDDEYVYYTTNQLIKAKRDGTVQFVLDDSFVNNDIYAVPCLEVDRIEDNWIFYGASSSYYFKIRTDGTSKTEISRDEYYKN